MFHSLLIVVCCRYGEPRPPVLLKSELAGSSISQKFNITLLKPKDIISKNIRETKYILQELHFLQLLHHICYLPNKMKEILFQQVHRFKLLLWIRAKQVHRDHVQFPHTTLSEMSTPVTQWTIVSVYMSSQTSLLSYLFMPASYLMLLATAATSDPSLFLRGVGVYCRRPGICRQQIQPINISAIIPLDSFWGFIVRRTVNSVEGTQGHVRQALMVCLSRLWFKQPNISPKYLKNNK